MPKLKWSKIEHLGKGAQGMVIPPNKEFTAVFGDQRTGTNIETPESLLRQIVSEESGNGGGVYEFIAQLDRKTIFKAVIQQAQLEKRATGKNPLLEV